MAAVRPARAQDKHAVAALWNECFPHGGAFDSYLLEHVVPRGETLLIEQDGEPVAMTHMLEFTLCVPEKPPRRAGYIYGVGTKTDERGKGHAARLLDAMHERMRGAGFDYAFLIPASLPLFSYYTRRGYRTAFFTHSAELGTRDLTEKVADDYDFKIIGADDYAQLDAFYNRLMINRTHILRGSHWRYAIGANAAYGGEVYAVYNGGTLRAAALGYAHRGKLILDECLYTDCGARDALLKAALRRTSLDSVRYAAPADDAGKAKPYGMLYALNAHAPAQGGPPPYINLLFN